MTGRRSAKWGMATYRRGLEAAVPAAPGVYSIARVSRHHGLLLAVEHLYIGKSNNLQRRWREHAHPRESNPGLHGLHGLAELEFWWRRALAEEISQLEDGLIRDLRPQLNRRIPSQAEE